MYSVPSFLRGLLPFFVAALLAGCGGSGSSGNPSGPVNPTPTCGSATGVPILVTGVIRYERLSLDAASGLGGSLQVLPARHVDVEIRSPGGSACFGRASTNASGQYSITILADIGTLLEVAAHSRTVADSTRDVFVHDGNTTPPTGNHSGDDAFSASSAQFSAAVSNAVDLTVPWNPGSSVYRPSIGFAILDTLIKCWDTVVAAGSGPLPTLHAYTRLGNNGVVGSSFYSTTGNAIAIKGGAAANLDGSDTDYFDDPVIAHEFGHYVEANLAHSQSRGGAHGGEPLEPAFAFSEGQATGFGQLILRSRFYIDSFRNSPGSFGVLDIESIGGSQTSTGIGSEDTCAELIYDLGDGGPDGPADTDGDAIGLPYTEVFGAMFTLNPAFDAPYIALYLERLLGLSATLTNGQISALLSGTPGDPPPQGIAWPVTGTPDDWPIQLAIPSTVGSAAPVDSLPGANKVQQNGFTSTSWHQFTLATSQQVTITMSISPVAGSGDDLDLLLYDNEDTFNAIQFSNNGGAASEQIGPVTLPAGTYIVVVDAFAKSLPNRANYSLTIN
jgi:hypothetical protein